jgi:adenine-specific DNA-methyltransferase
MASDIKSGGEISGPADALDRLSGNKYGTGHWVGSAKRGGMGKQLNRAPTQVAEARGAATPRERCAALRHVARAWAETLDEATRIDQVAAFVLEAIAAYETAGGTGPDGQDSHLVEQPEAQLAQSAGRAAAALPLADALHWLTSLYTGLMPDATRSRLGAFYTPPALAARLLDQAEEAGLDWRTARVLDPAAGGAVFLIEAATRMRRALADCEARIILAQIGGRLRGLELDGHAAVIGQRALELALADLAAAAGRPVPPIIAQADSLAVEPRAEFDLVVGNPPYGRVSLSPEDRSRFARSLYGHANLYGLFTDLALRWTKAQGLIAFLTPTSVLSGQYFSALRGLLAREAPPLAIDFVHARRGVFDDVQQETMLAVYRKGGAVARMQIHYLHLDTAAATRIERNGTVALPLSAAHPWLAPRQAAHSALIANAERMPARLGSLGYRVATGPLVWNRYKSQLKDRRSGRHTHPLIWAEAVGTDGCFRFRADKKNHKFFFKLEPGDEWLLVTQPAVLVQRTTAKEQRRRIIAAELPEPFITAHGGVVVENHLNMILADGAPLVAPEALACLLNSEVVDQLFRCISGSVAVSAFELEALPLPAPLAFAPLEEALSAGADRAALDRVCAQLYGMA